MKPNTLLTLIAALASAASATHAIDATPEEARAIAKEAYIYGNPVVDNYRIQYDCAVLGIYANSKDDAIYPMYRVDADGNPFDASKHSYTLRFEPGQYPPVNAFWSLTVYNLPESLLSANPLNRYLINSPMLPDLKKDADGGLTIHIQHESPGKDREANWLPTPDGPFWMAMRLYWPKTEALDGTWKNPSLNKVK